MKGDKPQDNLDAPPLVMRVKMRYDPWAERVRCAFFRDGQEEPISNLDISIVGARQPGGLEMALQEIDQQVTRHLAALPGLMLSPSHIRDVRQAANDAAEEMLREALR